MTPGALVAVAVGAALGGVLRWAADYVGKKYSPWPWGTLVVNVVASGALGYLSAHPMETTAQAALTWGMCGAMSTYSTFALEAVQRWHAAPNPRRAAAQGLVHVLAHVVLGLAAAALGYAL